MASVQGQGKLTARKESGFRVLFRQALKISRALPQYPYWHIDLNAGSGFNDVAQCEGSPLVFLDEAASSGRSFNAFFCDDNPEAIATLRPLVSDSLRLCDGCTTTTTCIDNALFLPLVAERIRSEERNPAYAFGTLLCDPNGYPSGFPLDAMIAFAATFPRIDLVLNLNVSLFAMLRGVRASTNPNVPHKERLSCHPDIGELLDLLGRPNWYVRNLPACRGPGQQFTILLGRTMEQGQRQFSDFYSLRTPEGKSILRNLRHNHGGFLPFTDLPE